MTAMNWTGNGKDGFDDRVEAVYKRLNKDLKGDAYAVNGRGGDNGIDIYVKREGRVTIVQVKFFPEGFAGGFAKSRRPQIRRSFEKALINEPDEWVLVVPATLTNSERKYVMNLTKEDTPEITIVDLPSLNEMTAGMSDLVTYFERDALEHAAKTYNQERAILIDTDDLVARVAALGEQADTLDPDWTFSFFRDGDVVGRQLVAKNIDAAKRSPITATVGLDLSGVGDDFRKAVDRSLGYGTPERLDLPATVVATFKVDGPAFIATDDANVKVSFIPDQKDVPNHMVALRLQGQDGSSTTYTGKSTWVGSAARGRSLHVRFFDTLRIELLMPFDRTQEVTLNLDLEPTGKEPAAVLRSIEAAGRLQNAAVVEMTIDGEGPLSFTRPPLPDGKEAPLSNSFAALKAIAEDLVIVQPTLNVYFGFPAAPSVDEMIELRCLRLMLQGKAIVLHEADQVSPVLNGKDSPQMREMLSKGSTSMVITHTEFTYSLFGHDLEAGMARIYAPRIHPLDGAALITALKEGRAGGMKMTFRTDDGYGMWMFLPERFKEDADGRVRPVPLGLPGIVDAPDVVRARFGDGAVLADKGRP